MTDRPATNGHQRCGAAKRKGGECGRPAGWGTDHVGIGRCKLHGGSTPSHQQAAEREKAERAVVEFGLRRDIGPHAALLEAVQTSAGLVASYEQVLAQLERDRLVGGVTKTVRLPPSRTMPGGGNRVEVSAARSVWLDLYNEERDRLVKACATAVSCGVAEREVKLRENEARLLAHVISAILTDLGHDLTEPKVRDTVRLRLLEGGKALEAA